MNIIRTAVAAALSLAAATASAQHAVTITWDSPANDSTTLTIRNDGPADLVAAELFAGPQIKGRVIFGAGTEGDLSFPHWADSTHYSVVTLGMDLQTGEAQSWHVNADSLLLSDIPFSASANGLSAYTGLRIIPVWRDGFEVYIPMSHTPFDPVTTYTFTDIAPVPAVPEPASALLMLAGCALVGVAARKGGAK
jgi:hypothetical protein